MIKIETFHHVSLPVTDIEHSKRFYIEILGLREIETPRFDFPVAWLQLGDKQLHLIAADAQSTLRKDKDVVPRDIHFAVRVNSYQETKEYLRSKGYYPDASDDLYKTKENPDSKAGFPQLYIMDPDRNIIELNAEQETKKYTHWKEEIAFEAWKHHANIGGADKDRMIQIATWLLGFSTAVVGLELNKIGEPVAAIFLSIAGIIVAGISASITLLYGGYANWNWAKADQIAKDYGWDRLDPTDSPFPKSEDKAEKPSFLVALALQQAKPRPTHKKLAPVFWWFLGMSLLSFGVHLSILVWGIVNL